MNITTDSIYQATDLIASSYTNNLVIVLSIEPFIKYKYLGGQGIFLKDIKRFNELFTKVV
jgi:hypothetical protein